MKKWVVAVVIGVALLLLSTGAGQDDNGVVKCGSAVMGPGDECEETRRGQTVGTRTYEDMKASQEAAARTFDSWGRWALLGGGLVLTLGGVAGIVMTRRRRAAAAAQPQPPLPPNVSFVQHPHQPPRYAPQQAPQQQAGQYAPQQYPQQQQVPQQYVPPRQPPYPPQSFGPTGPPD
jgi:hypothetical protein